MIDANEALRLGLAIVSLILKIYWVKRKKYCKQSSAKRRLLLLKQLHWLIMLLMERQKGLKKR